MIAVLGGTFDPIHKGHMHIAAHVFKRLPVDQIDFMPCAQPVHRDRPRASVEQRCDMIELEIAGRTEFALNRVEVDRKGPSYSIDSLREIHRRNNTRIALILGSDSYSSFSTWKAPEEILGLAHLVVCHRPGVSVDSSDYQARQTESVQLLEERIAGVILMMDVNAPDCASSRLRQQIANDLDTGDCLGPDVAEYIEHNGLYRGALD